MHLLFVDESSTPPKPTATSPKPYFILAGVIIPEGQWTGVAKELTQLKQSYRIRGEIKWRYFGAENRDARNTVRHLDQMKRNAFRHFMYGILTRRRSVRIIAAVANVRAAYATPYINDEHDLYAHCYKPLTERFQYFLQDLSRESGSACYGIVIGDQMGRKQDTRLGRVHQYLTQSSAPNTSNYDNIVETVALVPSHFSIGIQFADMVAGAIGRKFNAGDETCFARIEPALRRSPDGTVDGYGLIRVPYRAI